MTNNEPKPTETTASPEFEFLQPGPVTDAVLEASRQAGGTTASQPGEDVFEFRTYSMSWPPTDTDPGWDVSIAVVEGRYAATELVVRPPKGKGISRSMLHGLDIHRIVHTAASFAENDATDPDLMDRAMASLRQGKLTADGKLRLTAAVYQLAKLKHVPLHQVAADIGVHKKTLQRWAQQAEQAGYLSPEDRTW